MTLPLLVVTGDPPTQRAPNDLLAERVRYNGDIRMRWARPMKTPTRTAERQAALQEYIRREARDEPPVFVGRENAVRDIETAAETALEVWRAKDRFPGLTRVVQGAPGAGKSSLLAHLRRKWNAAREAGDEAAPLAVNISLLDLREPHRFRSQIDRKVPASFGERYAPIVAGVLVKLFIPSTRLSEETEAGARALVEQRSLPNPVVLMIDEAHNARPHENESAIFAHLHEGHVSDIPVLPVLAGLGHLREHLGQPGIRLTRFSDERKSVHTIAAISDDEVRELFGGWLEHFHVAATDGEGARWADALVRESQGWPMHTNHFLTSLAGQLLMPGRDPGRLASADLDAVRRRAAERRVDYYDTRYDNPLLQEREHEVAKTLAALRSTGPVKMKNMLDTIQSAFQYRDMADARGAFAVLRERGFLQRTPELDTRMSARGGRVYACPIPSLSSYAAACESPQHLAATRGDAALTQRLLREDPSAVDLRDAMGRAPLHVAAECRWADVAEVLLAAGADPDAPDAAGVTPREAWPEFDWPDPPPGSGQKQKRRRPGWQQKP